jgi:hypothetical protein
VAWLAVKDPACEALPTTTHDSGLLMGDRIFCVLE